MTWLVAGGAGYVGAHVVRALLSAGYRVVVLDDLSSGSPDAVPAAVPLVTGSVTEPVLVRQVLVDHGVTGVVHLAGRKSALQSMEQPLLYYRQNLGGTLSLVEAMADAGVRRIVLSSSAAVYGSPDAEAVTEETPPHPINPYGETKLASEWIVRDASRAFGMAFVTLRYFNVAGTASDGLRDRDATGLIPRALDAVLHGARPVVFGGDHATPDGSCVRDFVHVVDVARAHLAAAVFLDGVTGGGAVYNVGSGTGHSVRQTLDAIRAVTGVAFEEQTQPRRPGDPARVIASIGKIRRELGWTPRHGLPDMVRSEWLARAAVLAAGPAAVPGEPG